MFAAFAPVEFPHILGYDVAGEVLQSATFAPGTRVVGMLDPLRKGGYAELVAIADENLALIPAELDFSIAAAIPTAGLTGTQMIETVLNVQRGAVILITGALGAVGRFALHAAKARGAHVVAAVRGNRQAEASALGAIEIVALGEQAWAGAMFDHVIDTVGGEIVAPLCGSVKSGGRVISVATDPIPTSGFATPVEPFYVFPDGAMTGRLAMLVADRSVAVPIARVVPLSSAGEAQELASYGGGVGKIILEPDQAADP